jgi:stage IV sporulation protein FB
MRERFTMQLAAFVPAALFFYLGNPLEIAAILLPALCHELGHIVAILLLGMRIRRFRLELRGFCIEYYGGRGAFGQALAAAAGPLAGFAWAAGASLLGVRAQADWLCLSAGVSLLLSLFNLLPAMPLDGGRIVLALSCAMLGEQKGARLCEAVSLFTGTMLMAIGLWVMLRGMGAALLAAAIWILLYQESGPVLAKRREMI